MKKDAFYLKKNLVPPRAFSKSDIYTLLGNSGTIYFDKVKIAKLIETLKKTKPSGKEVFLKDELQKIGYKKTRHYFTIKECKILFSFIGFPVLTPRNVDFLILKRLIRQEQLDQFNINYK